MKAKSPRKKLFAATAVEERPVFASTMYASVLEYIHLHPRVSMYLVPALWITK